MGQKGSLPSARGPDRQRRKRENTTQSENKHAGGVLAKELTIHEGSVLLSEHTLLSASSADN